MDTVYSAKGFDNKGNPRPYKVYTALITQDGTNAPTAIVLDNTLGGIVTFNYNTTGEYIATLVGAFTDHKTTVICGSAGDGSDIGVVREFKGKRYDNDSILLTTMESDTNTSINSALLETPLEIKVYT